MTQASFSLYQLVSPQQLMQGRNQANSVPVQMPAAPQPAAPGLPDPRLLQQFSRISNLLSPDQLQLMVRPQPQAQAPVLFDLAPVATVPIATNPGNRIQTGLTMPTDLFSGVTAYAPAVTPFPPTRPSGTAAVSDDANQAAAAALATLQPGELKSMGKNDKQAFFKALLPAAIASEKKYGVPAELTLAQAALESGWGSASIGGYNIFGIKGTGPAGKTSVSTKEFYDGKWVRVKDGFAKYNNFAEAVERHGKLFHNGYYDKAVEQFPKDKSTYAFIDNIQGIYATDPNYSSKIKSIIENYDLDNMVNQTGMV